MPLQVTYELPISSVATSGEKYFGTVGAAASTYLTVDSITAELYDTNATNPPCTFRVRACTTAGTGTAVTGQKTNRNNAASITSAGNGTITVAPTAASGSSQDGAPLGFTTTFYKTWSGNLTVKASEFVGISVERNSASTTTPNGVCFVTVTEYP